jgi:UDP-N-acetyl-D-glucosamine dehydrogenase
MLLKKIESRSAVVGVVGLGYVGLPRASAFVDAGFAVLGFDTDPTKIELLARGEQYLHHLGAGMTARMQASGRFEATADFARLGEADAVLICVPTPLGEYKEPDLSYIERSGEAIAKCLRAGQLIVLESTTYPGTTREFLGPILSRGGLKPGR